MLEPEGQPIYDDLATQEGQSHASRKRRSDLKIIDISNRTMPRTFASSCKGTTVPLEKCSARGPSKVGRAFIILIRRAESAYAPGVPNQSSAPVWRA